jgi:hypothetical protein
MNATEEVIMKSEMDLHEVILHATYEQLEVLYEQYDNRLTELINDLDSTDEEIDLVASKILLLSTVVDTTKNQVMTLNPEYVRKCH